MDLFGEEPAAPVAENTPVALEDEQMGLLHPREMNVCLGHEDVEAKLLEAFTAGRMPHGLIFAGQKGIGKATMAYRLARFLLKHGGGDPNQDSMFDDGPSVYTSLDVAADDPVFRRVLSGGHADFMSVERAFDAAKNRYKDNVAVDAIRKVPGFLRMTASDGGWRVVIIDDADTMNRSAQNALLKILEEPPKNALLILVTHRMGALIPTIRSRAQVLHFNPLSQDHIEALLDRRGPISGSRDTLSALAEGSIGQAVSYLESDGLERLDEILALLSNAPDWDWPSIHALADRLAGQGQDEAYKMFQDLLRWVFAQMVGAKARGTGLASGALDDPALVEFMGCRSLTDLLSISEALHKHFLKGNGANLDKRQVILQAFSLIG